MLSDLEFYKSNLLAGLVLQWMRRQNIMKKHFQQRMSWLPYRWRTQRNAIRNANCKNQWVIKTLNAACTSLGEYACWSVCLSPPQPKPVSLNWEMCLGCCSRLQFVLVRIVCLDDNKHQIIVPFLNCLVLINQTKGRDVVGINLLSIIAFLFCLKSVVVFPFRTSNQSRIPAEFKHITRRRKRN